MHGKMCIRDRHYDTGNINLLEGISSKKWFSYVRGDCHHRNRIHVCGRNTCNQICGPRAGGCQTYSDFSRSTGITICGMRSTPVSYTHLICRTDLTHLLRIIPRKFRHKAFLVAGLAASKWKHKVLTVRVQHRQCQLVMDIPVSYTHLPLLHSSRLCTMR